MALHTPSEWASLVLFDLGHRLLNTILLPSSKTITHGSDIILKIESNWLSKGKYAMHTSSRIKATKLMMVSLSRKLVKYDYT